MLTEREKEVYKLKKQGMLQNEIATRLKISQPAVSGFYNRARKKIREAEEILDFVKNHTLE